MTTIADPHETQNAPDLACKHSGWKSQFGHPTGKMGKLIGRLMAVKNWGINQIAIRVLDVQPTDRVLEIGFGHGRSMAAMAEKVTEGCVSGIDISQAMVELATQRNRGWIDKRRVDIRIGDVCDGLPYKDGAFTRVLAVNSFQHVSDRQRGLSEVLRVLEPGGIFLIGIRMKHPTRRFLVAPGFTHEGVEKLKNLVKDAGFAEVRTELHHAGRDLTCLIARK